MQEKSAWKKAMDMSKGVKVSSAEIPSQEDSLFFFRITLFLVCGTLKNQGYCFNYYNYCFQAFHFSIMFYSKSMKDWSDQFLFLLTNS